MKKNAFTLIELLAVIVILAIIALIATPIILGIIRDAKDNANKRSIDNYAKAIENAIVKYQLSGKKLEEIIIKTTDGRNFSNVEDFKVEYEGNVVCDTIEIYEDGSIFLAQCEVNGEVVNYTYGEPWVYLAQKNPTTGFVPTQDQNGNIIPGSEFIIKVNNKMYRLTFFVLSNSEDGKYVNLIAEQNIAPDGTFTSEPQDGDEWYETVSNSYDARYGPQKAYLYLSKATNNWTNIPIIENFTYEDEGNQISSSYGYKGIISVLDEEAGIYTTIISLFGDKITYENMRARLPKYSDIAAAGCPGSSGSCPIWMVNYLYGDDFSQLFYNESNRKVNSLGSNYGYWSLSSCPGQNENAFYVDYVGGVYRINTNETTVGIRPVITVLKSDLLKAM